MLSSKIIYSTMKYILINVLENVTSGLKLCWVMIRCNCKSRLKKFTDFQLRDSVLGFCNFYYNKGYFKFSKLLLMIPHILIGVGRWSQVMQGYWNEQHNIFWSSFGSSNEDFAPCMWYEKKTSWAEHDWKEQHNIFWSSLGSSHKVFF